LNPLSTDITEENDQVPSATKEDMQEQTPVVSQVEDEEVNMLDRFEFICISVFTCKREKINYTFIFPIFYICLFWIDLFSPSFIYLNSFIRFLIFKCLFHCPLDCSNYNTSTCEATSGG